MKVREIMTAEVATATLDTNLREIAKMMREEDVGGIPVLDGDDLAGIVTDRDIALRCVAEGRDPEDTTAEDILSQRLETVDPDADVEEAAKLMARRQIRRLPVVEDGRLAGMVSLGDIAVKGGEYEAADALEDVSEGVKPRNVSKQARQARTQPAPARVEQSARAPRSESGSPRETSRKAQAGKFQPSAKRQAISNRNAREEEQRQARVVPIRDGKKTSGKKRAS